jgi:hypothetical protein
MKAALGKRLGAAGLPLVGALPHNRLISSVRLDEICAALAARVLSGSRGQQDLTVDQARIADFSFEVPFPCGWSRGLDAHVGRSPACTVASAWTALLNVYFLDFS